MSWLLPFALIAVVLAAFGERIRLPLESGAHKILILWGGWLLTCMVVFSVIAGIFHAHYLIALVPPLGALVGFGFALLWSRGGAILVAAVALTLAFQFFALFQYKEPLWEISLPAALFVFGSVWAKSKRRAAYPLLLSAMLIVPAYWTLMTSASDADQNLPGAYSGGRADPAARPSTLQWNWQVHPKMLEELQANAQGAKYLLATPSSQQGAPIVLATGKPVLYLGGFAGQDEVVSLADLQRMIAEGELRYVLYGRGRDGRPEIADWLIFSCINMFDYAQTGISASREDDAFLYDCKQAKP